jgi:predicted dehydrogenase
MGPGDRITIGFIGFGKRSRQILGRFLRIEGAQVVAVSEVVRERREQGRKLVDKHYAQPGARGPSTGCAAYNDFRELLARDDIDAVVIGTPDHWHAIQTVAAAAAGKDIYCEKPMSLVIAHGRKMVQAVRRHDVIFQTGSQQRSEYGGKFRQAVELVRNGRIGTVKRVHVGVGGPPVPCNLPDEPCPDGTDWEMWNGPAPARGYHHELCPRGIHNHFPAFRRYREYAGGGLADMGAHHFDIAQWALGMDESGPVRIEPPPGNATKGLKFTYASGVEMFHGGVGGCTFEGTKGTIVVTRGSITSDPPEILEQPIGPDDKRVYRSRDHARNWLMCVRSRKRPICDVETGHRSATICHLANIGYELRRPLTWDPEKEQFAGDAEANRLRDRAVRAPWTL